MKIQQLLSTVIVVVISSSALAREIIDLTGSTEAVEAGDLVTVILEEDLYADFNERNRFSDDYQLNASAVTPAMNDHTIIGLSNIDVGEGQKQSRNRIETTIGARVISVEPNGVMYIAGEKTLTFKKESHVVRITGYIRPNDINYGNEVQSAKVTNMTFKVQAEGDVADADRPNILTRFFRWVGII